MATTQEVDVLIKTVADTSGVQQLQQSMQQAQQTGQQVQQQLSAQQQFANQVLRQSMAQVPQTLEAFRGQFQAVASQVGARPTLRPEDLGIGPAATNAAQAQAEAVSGVAEATRQLGTESQTSGVSVQSLGEALLGVGSRLSIVVLAAETLRRGLAGLVQETVSLENATRQNTIVLGQQAAAYQTFATTVSRQTGETRQSLLEAGTAAAQFSRQVGLPPQALDELSAYAILLGRIRGEDVATSMNQLTAAMQGNAQAAQALGFNLDSAYIAYTQLGGATSDVFDMLDASTQAWLRYQSAVAQAAAQAQNATGPAIDLARAQGDLAVQVERIVATFGPPLVEVFAAITEGASKVVEVFANLYEIEGALAAQVVQAVLPALQTVAQAVAQFPQVLVGVGQTVVAGLGVVLAALGTFATAVRDQVVAIITGVFQAAQQALAAAGGVAQQINEIIKNATGVDLLGGLATALGQAGQAVNGALQGIVGAIGDFSSSGLPDQIQNIIDKVTGAAQAVTNPLTLLQPIIEIATQVKGQIDEAAAAAAAAGEAQIANLLSALAGPLGALDEARAREIAATQELNRLKLDSLQIGAQEAAVRLGMLPAQQEMARLQNQINQAQIEAQQRLLPTSRALQQTQLELSRLQAIAEDPTRTAAERQAAQARGAQLELTVPRLTVANIDAQQANLPIDYAAQDAQRAAQLQQLQQQQQLFPLDFAGQQNALLSQIAQAALEVSKRDVQLAIDAVNVIVQAAGPITPDQEAKIAQVVSQQIAAVIHAAVGAANTRPATPSLAGAGP